MGTPDGKFRPVWLLLIVVVLVGLAALALSFYQQQNTTQEARIADLQTQVVVQQTQTTLQATVTALEQQVQTINPEAQTASTSRLATIERYFAYAAIPVFVLAVAFTYALTQNALLIRFVGGLMVTLYLIIVAIFFVAEKVF